ncbi:toprim domain-containing protein [Bryobacter aggregatus]|uniref:toprim domain-containing protein n=1 Tax=Bryobacter aggregatus TaxID=360054 RepID=UPI0004E21CED|nr:toprim domain-containing protein [Bryobacter aggregatus]
MAERGESLSDAALGECRPIRQGRYVRAFCPFHGGDAQRSLSVDTESGRFQCFACQVWGYLDSARHTKQTTQSTQTKYIPQSVEKIRKPLEVQALLDRWTSLLPASPAALYLEDRRIPLELAQRHRLGFAPPGTWPQRRAASSWPFGRLVVPHTTPGGQLVNLYSRAVGHAPKEIRHDHLSGAKGYFGAGDFPASPKLYVCEGPLDALSLLAAGAPAAVAIFGVQGWRHDWNLAEEYVFALDNDEAGRKALGVLARELRLRGRKVSFLSAEQLGGAKDVNEAWVAGTLDWQAS